MNNSRINTYKLSSAAVLAALYAVLTIALAPISYGAVQFRVSELLCIMPFFVPFSAWGLFAGCIVANLITGNVFDIVFGSLATLAAALITAYIGKRSRNRKSALLACFQPVIFNALVVGAVITWAYDGMNIFQYPGVFAFNALTVGLGEAAVLYILGYPLTLWLPRQKFFADFMEKANG